MTSQSTIKRVNKHRLRANLRRQNSYIVNIEFAKIKQRAQKQCYEPRYKANLINLSTCLPACMADNNEYG